MTGWHAAAALGPVALVTPLWLSAPVGWGGRLAAAAMTVAATILLLHAVAAGRIGGGWLTLCVAPLAIHGMIGHGLGQRYS